MRKNLLGFVMIFCIAIITLFSFGACNRENEWIPEVQGSYAVEMEYEELKGKKFYE